MNVISLLYKNFLKQSFLDRKIDDKEANVYRKIKKLCLDKRTDLGKIFSSK